MIGPKFAVFELYRIFYKCWAFRLEGINKMSVRTTPESPPPEEKIPHGMVRAIALTSFGDGARNPRQIARETLPLFERLLPDGLSEAYRQKRILKPRKRRATSDSDSKGSKKLPDPRLDPDFDSKDPLGLSRWSLIFKSVNKKKRL